MKVAWFTPLSTRSAIAEYSVHVCAALEQLCQVDLWVGDDEPGAGDDPGHRRT